MEVQKIWPEPPLEKWNGEVPEIPEKIVVFGQEVSGGSECGGKRELSEVIEEMCMYLCRCLKYSVEIGRVRDVEEEAKKIEQLFSELKEIIQEMREKEAMEKILFSLREQIKKKKSLIESLNLKEIIWKEEESGTKE